MLKFFLFAALVIYSFSGYTQNTTIDSLSNILKTQKEDSNKVNTLNTLSHVFINEGNYTNAIEYANIALILAEKIKFKSGKADAYINLGRLYNQKKDPLAEKNYLLAVAILQESGDKRTLAHVYQLLAFLQQPDNYPEGLKYQYKRLKLYEELNDTAGIAGSLEQIGFLYRVLKNYPEAQKNLLAALSLFEKTGNKQGTASAIKKIAAFYRAIGNYSQALKNDSAALLISEKLGDQFDIAWSLATIGFNMEGLYSQEKATEVDEIKTAGYKQALKNYFAALNIFRNKLGWSENSYPVMAMYHSIGNIKIKLHDLKESRFYLEKSLQLAGETNHMEILSKSYKSLSLLDSIQGNYQQAYAHYRQYLIYNDSVINDEDRQQALTYKIQYDTDKNEIIARAEQAKKDAETKRLQQIQFFVLAVFFLLAIFFFLSNRQKQKARLKIEKAYAELKATQQQLIHTEKMASLGELTAGIAHEIQNPLNFVNNFSEVSNELIDEMNTELDKGDMKEAKIIAGDIKQNLEKINHHGQRAGAIVKGMLQHSRSSSGQKEATNINALADEYFRLAYHGLRAKDKTFHATIKTEYDENIGKINIIPQDIGRVILNLINNAFYAVTEKKKSAPADYEPTITVGTSLTPPPAGGGRGAEVLISVKDNGNGIPQRLLDKIFQPFFTTKPTGQGTGLGLSLSYDIMKAHGGELKVETSEGRGTEFIMLLPSGN